MTIQRHFKLALTAGHTIPLVINANQYDSGEQWLFTLYNDGVRYTPSSGAIVGIKADRLGIINTGTVDANGRVVINETRQMTAAVGKNIFELLIDDQTHGTANFMVLVEPRPGDQADFSDSDLSLLQQAIDGTSETAIKAGVQEWMNENLTDPTDPIVDASLSLSGAAADAKKTGDEITALKSAISAISRDSGLTETVKQALMSAFNHVIWDDDDPSGQTYIDDLEDALYPPTNLISISAVYTQSGVVSTMDTLNSLRDDLVVTAHYDDFTTETILNYALSGQLTLGTSTITVSYSGKSTTFNVEVTQEIPSEYTQVGYITSAVNGTPSQEDLANTPYINLNFPASDLDIINYTVEVEFLCMFNSTTCAVFGGRNIDNNSNTKGIQLLLGSTDTVIMYGNSSSASSALVRTALGYALSLNERHTVMFKNGNISVDGTTVTQTGAQYAMQSSSHKWKLFGRQQASLTTVESIAPMIGNVYKFVIKDSYNANVINLIPAKRNADNVYGMYDTVNNAFYISAIPTGFSGGN